MSVEGYYCPHCDHRLTDDHMRAVRMKGVLVGEYFTVTCPFELPAQLGVYGAECKYPGLTLEPGARVDFRCPSCDGGFTLKEKPNLSALRWRLADGSERQVVFNRILGRRMTAVVCPDEKRILEVHGEDGEQLSAGLAKLVSRLTWRR
jgi:hypothetical protein